jgi:hypothetical protein
MDNRFFRVLSIVLGVLFVLSLIFITLFGVRLAKINNIKNIELNAAVSKREKEMVKTCQLNKEKTESTYTAEEVFGSFQFSYPKMWETNVKRTDGNPQLLFLADPNLIIMTDNTGPATALRLKVITDNFDAIDKENKQKTNGAQLAFKGEDITLSGIKGRKYTGSTSEMKERQISFVLLPLRDKTLYIGTDDYKAFSKQFQTILDSFKLSK